MIRQKVDYGKYRYSQKEILKYIGESAALCGAVDYLFYQTPWVMLLVVPVSVFFLKWKKKQMIRERKRRLNYQFRDALNSMSVAVQAGYSVENAVSACVRDLEQLYPKNEDIVAEFRYIETQQRVSVPAGIILYLQLASPGFLDILYGNPFGICAMTVCLTVYGAAYWMGKRIVEIEV